MPSICHVEITPKNAMPRVWRAAHSAQEAGWMVRIVGVGDSSFEDKIEYIGFPEEPSRLRRMLIRSKKMVEAAAATDADIVQLHSPELLLYLGKLKGKKVIFDSHEFYFKQIETKSYIPNALRKLISRIYLMAEASAMKRVDAVLYPCTLDGTLPNSTKYAKRCELIANYSRQDIRIEAASEKEDAIVYAGGLTPERGISVLAEAAHLAGVKLYLCGPFASQSYEEEILSGPYGANIQYMGSLDRDTLFRLYSKCRIGMSTLLPVGQYHQIDILPTKIYEYMQCGIPVICSAFPYIVQQNRRHHFGSCVDPSNAEEIASAIQYLMLHPEEARQMGENGLRAVQEEFNWAVEEKKLLALYQEILSE